MVASSSFSPSDNGSATATPTTTTSIVSSSTNDEATSYHEIVKRQFKNHKDVDAMLAKDLNSLSLQEREQVFEKIHGVDQLVPESSELIEQRLMELSRELDLIQDKPAYDTAFQESNAKREYLTSRKFRLYFLRCENFNVYKAASRIVAYMEKMLRYFGPEVLGRPLYYSDLHPEAKEYMNKGAHQVVLQAKDSAGRGIFLDHYYTAEKLKKSNIAMMQTYLYQYYTAIENDEMVQRHGMVFIGYNRGKLVNRYDSEAYDGVAEIQNWFPIKVPAIQLCFDNPAVSIFAPLAWIGMGPELRQKVRIHNGAHMECMYALQGFGIPVDALPVTQEGTLINTSLHRWIAHRQAKEEAIETREPKSLDTIVETPLEADVCLWRGRIYQKHPGNIRMKALIDEYRPEYDKARHGERADVAMRVVATIQTIDGGRFLTKDPSGGGWWIEVSDREAQVKVSKSFRSSRAKKPKTHNKSKTIKEETSTFQDQPHQGKKRLRIVPSSSDCMTQGCDDFNACCDFGRTSTPSPPPRRQDFPW